MTAVAGPPFDEERAIRLMQSIWSAALEADSWEQSVADAADLFGAESAKVAILDLSTNRATSLASHRIDPEIALRWQTGQGGRDLWAEAGLRSLPSGRVAATGAQLVPRDVYRRSEIYHEVSRPAGHEDCLATAIAVDGPRLGFVSLYRRELFGRTDLVAFERVAQQLRRALVLQASVLRRATAAASLESVAAPALVCDASGKLEAANPAAERLLREGDGVCLLGGRIHARLPESDARLQRAIGGASETARGSGAHGSGMLAIQRFERPPLGALAVPAPGLREVPLLAQLSGGPAVLVVLSDPEQRPELPSEVLQRVFQLTPAEAGLARALARGATLAEYADTHEVTIETARTRVKAVLHKTGVHRQADLVRLVLTSVAGRAAPPPDEE